MNIDYAAIYTSLREGTGYKYGHGKVRGWRQVADLIERAKPERLLDYGSGLGAQYLMARTHELWGGLLPYCYDVGVPHFAEKPEGKFDGVICGDVLEHIDEPDLDEVLSDIFGFVSRRELPRQSFVYFHISTVASKRRLPDGRNMHLCVQPASWWRDKLMRHERHGLIIATQFRPDDA